MSYNIDTWNLKKLNNLSIPLESFFKCRPNWYPDKEYDENGILTLTSLESEITGKVDENGNLQVKTIDISGEGSGTTMFDIIEPALKDSTGEMIATCVWEGGDSINRITVKDGKVTWQEIEI